MLDLHMEIMARGEHYLAEMVTNQMQENIQLDFKQKADRSHGKLDKSDRQNLGQVLSALSNSMGGLVIFGVDARKGIDNLDCAQRLMPIKQIELFASQVNTAVSNILMPKHDGIQIDIVRENLDSTAGYLIIRVERSDRRPHRSEASGDKQYYKRVSDNSVAMEHFDIEDAFNRLVPPRLDIDWHAEHRYDSRGPDGIIREAVVNICLSNSSRVSGRYPYINLRSLSGLAQPPNRLLLEENALFQTRRYKDWSCIDGGTRGANFVIHPGQSVVMAHLNLHVRLNAEGGAREINGQTPRDHDKIFFEYQIGCEHSRMIESTMEIKLLDIARQVL